MKKRILLVTAALILSTAGLALAQESGWEQVSRENLLVETVFADPDNPQIIYFGSHKGAFKSIDSGRSWRNILSIRGENRKVKFFYRWPGNRNILFCATGNGLFRSSNQGVNWQRIFKGKNSAESECRVLEVLLDTVYLGTKAGLFTSQDRGRTWNKETGKLGNSSILAIAVDSKKAEFLYVVSIDGVYRSKDRGLTWERVFVAKIAENGDEAQESNEDLDEEERLSDIRHLVIDPGNAEHLYLATTRGVYETKDSGASWVLLPEYGLLAQDVRFLLLSSASCLYAATRRGVFQFRGSRWQELYLGLAAERISFLALDKTGNLYAACEKGLFRYNINFATGRVKDNLILEYCRNEPDINQVQKAAIKYAEVDPEKIKQWRKKAAKKAFFPRVSANVGRNVTDLWHWESGSSTKAGDDILVQGNDAIEWDVGMSWDLGEIIWNSDQTSIDVRSRLMVQLRDDILDEVTRLYFERLRVKMELDDLEITEKRKLAEKELRLRELTASIDALTGGYFSRNLNGS